MRLGSALALNYLSRKTHKFQISGLSARPEDGPWADSPILKILQLEPCFGRMGIAIIRSAGYGKNLSKIISGF